jgi:protein-L-isoaspartate O-methyltransferase
MRAAYSDRTLVTRLGSLHADHARPGDHPNGRPTSSATQPGLVVAMYRHASITDDSHVLDIGTGSGYGTALLTARLGNRPVTSIDVTTTSCRRQPSASTPLACTTPGLPTAGSLSTEPLSRSPPMAASL